MQAANIVALKRHNMIDMMRNASLLGQITSQAVHIRHRDGISGAKSSASLNSAALAIENVNLIAISKSILTLLL